MKAATFGHKNPRVECHLIEVISRLDVRGEKIIEICDSCWKLPLQIGHDPAIFKDKNQNVSPTDR